MIYLEQSLECFNIRNLKYNINTPKIIQNSNSNKQKNYGQNISE